MREAGDIVLFSEASASQAPVRGGAKQEMPMAFRSIETEAN